MVMINMHHGDLSVFNDRNLIMTGGLVRSLIIIHSTVIIISSSFSSVYM